MTKDVLIAVKGLQFFDAEDNEPLEIITAGSYYNKNGKHYIIYDEVTEGFNIPTNNKIKISDNVVQIVKKGVTNVTMLFEKNKKNMTYYRTPYGDIMIGIMASDIRVTEEDENITINIEYSLEMNYEHAADCKITIEVKSKELSEFKL